MVEIEPGSPAGRIWGVVPIDSRAPGSIIATEFRWCLRGGKHSHRDLCPMGLIERGARAFSKEEGPFMQTECDELLVSGTKDTEVRAHLAKVTAGKSESSATSDFGLVARNHYVGTSGWMQPALMEKESPPA